MRRAAATAAALCLCAGAACAQAEAPAASSGPQEGAAAQPDKALPAILVVNKERVIEASAPFAALRRTEQEIRAKVEARLEEVKAQLEAEELELTSLRATLSAEEFQRRTRDFDRRVRQERRDAQERGAMLLRFFNEAQAALRSALPRVLEDLRRDRGATLIVDAGAVLAISSSADVTDEAIALFDAAMGGVTFDPPEELVAP